MQPAYDGQKSLYTAGPLPFEGMEFVVDLADKEQAKDGSKKTDKDAKGAYPRYDVFLFQYQFQNIADCACILLVIIIYSQLICNCRRERKFKVAIRLASRPDLHHLRQFLAGKQRDSPQETIQALDVVMRETPTRK